MNPKQTDLVFQALSHKTRRDILDIVKQQPGCSVSDVAARFDTSRIAIMKHLRILYDAELLLTEKQGRQRSLFLNVMPIQLIYDRWTDEYAAFWAGHLADLKYRIETKEEGD